MTMMSKMLIVIKASPGNVVIELKTFTTEVALLSIPDNGQVMIVKRLILSLVVTRMNGFHDSVDSVIEMMAKTSSIIPGDEE